MSDFLRPESSRFSARHSALRRLRESGSRILSIRAFRDFARASARFAFTAAVVDFQLVEADPCTQLVRAQLGEDSSLVRHGFDSGESGLEAAYTRFPVFLDGSGPCCTWVVCPGVRPLGCTPCRCQSGLLQHTATGRSAGGSHGFSGACPSSHCDAGSRNVGARGAAVEPSLSTDGSVSAADFSKPDWGSTGGLRGDRPLSVLREQQVQRVDSRTSVPSGRARPRAGEVAGGLWDGVERHHASPFGLGIRSAWRGPRDAGRPARGTGALNGSPVPYLTCPCSSIYRRPASASAPRVKRPGR